MNLTNLTNFHDKDILMKYLRTVAPIELDENTIALLYDSISSKVISLTNESSLQDFESSINSMDLKSKGFINSTDPNAIPLIGSVWELFSLKDEIPRKDLTEAINRGVIQHLYYFVTVIILQRLVNKIIYLGHSDPNGEDLVDFNVLLQEYLRKVDPRMRKYLNGSRINFIDKIYVGFDTEYQTKEFKENNLLSTQLSYTGTLLIRVNNVDKGFDFSDSLLADGSKVKDSSHGHLMATVPSLSLISSIMQSVLKDLRSFMENSINDEFITLLNDLNQQGLILKTNETGDILEFMVPLLEDDNGVPYYENNFKFHVAGTPNPTFMEVIDTVTELSSSMVDRRYNYFLKMLNGLDGKYDTVVNNNDTGLGIADNSTGTSSTVNETIEGEIMTGDIPSNNTVLNNPSNTVIDNTNTENVSTENTIIEVTPIDVKPLKSYKYVNALKENVNNPFTKDNNLPNVLTKVFSKYNGVLRGDHRRNKIIILGCHFSIADLSMLSDFDSIKDKFDNIQDTLLTVSKPFLVSKGRTVFLRDTMLLAPAGGSLDNLGVLYNLPKLNIGDYITRMSDLRNENPTLFMEYAMRDSEITLRHIIEMEKASHKITGVGSVPATLSGLARRFVFKFWKENNIDLAGFIYFGKYKITDFHSIYTPKAIQSIGNIGLVLPIFMGGFRGGRNESYAFGVNRNEKWYDYDLTSAYTTSMSFLGIPDFGKSVHVVTQKSFDTFMESGLKELNLENTYSMFHVIFKFPETVIHPCLPVSIDDTSTLYPSEGTTISTGYEMYLALAQGCKIKIKEGVIVPFKGETKPYSEVIKYLQEERRKYPKGSLYNLLYKQLGNSIYGQTAQGFNKSKSFSSRTGNLESVGTSTLSNPLISSHISGLTRAVLGELIRQIELKGGKIVSATTDGFITNIPNLADNIDNSSRLLRIYADLRELLSGSREFIELKDSSNGIYSWTTRGQLGLNPESKISAMTGFQPRNYSKGELINLIENAFDKEEYSIFYGQKSLRKVNDIYKEGGHVTAKITEKVFRVVYDNRREIIETGISPKEALLFSKPFKDLSTALTIKTIGKLGSDLYAPNSNYSNKSGSKDYVDLAIRTFIRALTQGELNLQNPFNNYQEIVSYIKETFSFDITPNYVASQKRRDFIPNIVPVNQQTREIVDKLKIKFPDFDDKNFMSSK